MFLSVGGVTREIVQPAKASNFSENRLLKRASPHDTETIYQLYLSSSIFHYSLALEYKLVLVKMNNNSKKMVFMCVFEASDDNIFN
jgi:hypothetical protein